MTKLQKLEGLQEDIEYALKNIYKNVDEYLIFAIRQGYGYEATTYYNHIMSDAKALESRLNELNHVIKRKILIKNR